LAEPSYSFSTWINLSVSSLAELPGLTAAKCLVERFGDPRASVHAVLFYGVRGAGMSDLGQCLALSWLGGEESLAGKAFQNGRSADVLWVEPMGPSRIINVKQIAESRGSDDKFDGTPVSAFLRTGPLQGKSKVVIVQDADRMNSQAGNAVLKMLEEPPEYAKFILTTSAVRSLIPTILSRCLAVPCELPANEPSGNLALLARGAPGLVRELGQHADLFESLVAFANSLRSRPRSDALAASEELKGIAESYQKAAEKNARASNAEILELLGNAIQTMHPDWTEVGFEIAEAHRRVVGNASAGLVFDNLMARILR
jgi:DNA polymerase III delta prime subunit